MRGRGPLCTALSFQSLVVSGATEIKADYGCIRAIDPDMSPSISLGSDVTMALAGNEVTHVSLLLTSFTSPHLPLSTGHEPCVLALSLPYRTIPLLAIIASCLPSATCGSPCPTQSVTSLGRTLLSRIIILPDCLVPEAPGWLMSEILPAPNLET